jgi:hypothetical protein
MPAPPYVTSRDYPAERVARMQAALVSVLDRSPRSGFCDDLFISGVSLAPLQVYAKILVQEEAALGHGYYEMHATSPAVM